MYILTHRYIHKPIFIEIHAWMSIKLNYKMYLCMFAYININLKANTFACILIYLHNYSGA